jgi:hypothetical protein
VNEPEAQRKRSSSASLSASLSIAARTLPAVAAVALIALGGASFVGRGFGGAPWAWGTRTDSLPDSERQARQQAFEAIGSLRLAVLPQADTKRAIADMHLSMPEQQALTADLAAAAPSAPSATEPAQSPKPLAGTAESARLRLVSITLWDTDVEDGDIVRIDSEGFSRTMLLSKHGATIAVPLGPSGVVRVTGINDGDGGGITVGLASGAAKILFPIMSVGQTLQLAATAR